MLFPVCLRESVDSKDESQQGAEERGRLALAEDGEPAQVLGREVAAAVEDPRPSSGPQHAMKFVENGDRLAPVVHRLGGDDHVRGADRVTKIKLGGCVDGKAKVLVKGKGANLSDPTLGGVATRVRVQLVNEVDDLCRESTLDAADVNLSDQLKAKDMQ